MKGANNPVADALSQADVSAVAIPGESPPVIDFRATAAAQDSDPELHSNFRQSHSLCLTPPSDEQCSTYVLHCLLDPVVRSTQRLLAECYVWPGIKSNVRKWAQMSAGKDTATHHSSSATFSTRFDRG